MSNTTVPIYLGLSSDYRTNRWSITCPACKKPFEPATTMFFQQSLQCPAARCGKFMRADYHAETVWLTEY